MAAWNPNQRSGFFGTVTRNEQCQLDLRASFYGVTMQEPGVSKLVSVRTGATA